MTERLSRKLRRRTFELKERTKELRCVYGISRIFDRQGVHLDRMLQAVVDLLPASWQYPETACARIEIEGREFETRGYSRPRHRQRAVIRVHGKAAGRLEVGYLEKRPAAGEGSFLPAERKLIEVVAERIGRLVEQRKAEEGLLRSQERLRELLKNLERAREDERRRIAHEIHDHLGHALVGLKMDAGAFLGGCPGRRSCAARSRAMGAQLSATLRDVQRLASELRPVLLDDFGFCAAVSTLAEEFERRHGISCELSLPAKEPPLGKELSLALYRCVQELLTNAARHSGATRVLIRLRAVRGRLDLRVRDDGRGLPPRGLSAPKTLGLLGIRERVQGFGGTLEIKSSKGKGAALRISLPCAGGRR